MKNPFTTIIGAGQVGATTAQRLIEKDICDVVLFDVVDGLAQGKALDLMEAAPIEGHGRKVSGTSDYKNIKGSGIVVITAGFPRKPGMSREDLLKANAGIIRTVSLNIKKYSPESIVITVTNPLDIMTHITSDITGFEKSRVFGMAGVLDSARMRFFISEALGCRPCEISSMVLGGHGDLMVPIMSSVKRQNKPIDNLSRDEAEAIIKRTRSGGAEIVSLLRSGSAFYAPASSVAQMVSNVLNDNDEILPACAFLDGAYGIKNTYCGVPVRLGRNGIKEIVQIPLTDDESKFLLESARKVQEGVRELSSLKY